MKYDFVGKSKKIQHIMLNVKTKPIFKPFRPHQWQLWGKQFFSWFVIEQHTHSAI